MGLLANLPVGLAPGLGLNAYVRVASTAFGMRGRRLFDSLPTLS